MLTRPKQYRCCGRDKLPLLKNTVSQTMPIQRRQFLQFAGALTAVVSTQRLTQAMPKREIGKLAKGVTVLLITQGSPGSGVLIGVNGTTYIVLTAAHVVKGTNPGEELYAVTSDGQQHSIDTSTIQRLKGIDLAILRFQSNQSYPVVKVGDSDNVVELDDIFVAGYPKTGRVLTVSNFTITPGALASRGQFEQGYGLVYTATTKEGMSGGPVLNQAGDLIGIHGLAEGERIQGVPVKEGFNLGIPINRFLGLVSLASLGGQSPMPNNEPKSAPAPDSQKTLGQKNFSFEVITVDPQGQINSRTRRQARYFSEDLGNGVTLDIVAIPGGRFLMGSPESELERRENESPQHQVNLQPFYMGKFAVTQAQWRAVASMKRVGRKLPSDPSRFKGKNRPVEFVSWEDAIEFCARLSRRTKRNYRLPSAAEWEYACRAETSTAFYFGETITPDIANYNGNNTYGLGPKGVFREQTTKVGGFPPNAFGLYDMHGNVWQWCLDHGHEDYSGAPTDGSAWVTGGNSDRRIIRGGSWRSVPKNCRSASRGDRAIDTRRGLFGLRVTLSALENNRGNFNPLV